MTKPGMAEGRGCSCPGCSTPAAQAHAPSRRGLQLRACRSCGLVYQATFPSRAVIEAAYDASYYDCWGDADVTSVWGMKVRTATALLERAERLLTNGPPGRRLLDVGCAHGAMLTAGRQRGFEVVGVEISPAADRARALGFEVHRDRLELLGLPGQSFDIVTLVDVVEHMPEPLPFAREVRRVLKPGGIVLLVAPDVGSLAARCLRSFWPHYMRDHLLYFDRRSLSVLLTAAGLEVLEVRRALKYLSIAYIVGHLRRFTPGVSARVLSLAETLIPARLANVPIRLSTEMMMLARVPPAVTDEGAAMSRP